MNLFMEVNNFCELKCKFCIADNNFLHEKCSISLELVHNLIERYKNEETKCVFITGGEPLIHPHILEILKMFSDAGYYIYITTNGQMLSDPEFAVRLLSIGINRIAIPVYGSVAERHDWLTGINGSFEKLMIALDNLFYIREKYSKRLKIELRLLMSAFTNNDNEKIVDIIAKRYPSTDYITMLGLQLSSRSTNYEDEIEISLTESAESLRKTIDRIFMYEIKASQTGIPLCILGKEYIKLYDGNVKTKNENNINKLFMFPHLSIGPYMKTIDECMYRSNTSKMKDVKCLKCLYNDRCDGLQTRYVKKYGFNDIVPITE